MFNQSNLTFKISSALKSIIGRDLINNKFVAIYELVKNSYDAGAHNVKLCFENIYNETKISIIDDGCGMNYEDIVNKWLFVAYSEKKLRNKSDYRNIINRRIYAGAKGVGRFSCDRLGSYLTIITRKENDVKTNCIEIDWDNFEKDDKNEFEQIPVMHKFVEKDDLEYINGTKLIISKLRETWDRNDLLELKNSLKRLSNPNNEEDDFTIYIEVPELVQEDKLQDEDREIVNGIIRNDVFEKLGLRSTSLIALISEDGSKIVVTLEDRGTFMFRATYKNKYSDLKNIKVYLYYLNRSGKGQFTRIMGVEPVNYGSIFVYKNGFRILPYGEPGRDIFDLDRRKAQGFYRFLGTRDLLGRIEIIGENENLSETSSRDGGIVQTEAFEQLTSFFKENPLKVLEKYMEIIKWGEPYKINDQEDVRLPELQPQDVMSNTYEVITKMFRNQESLKIEYNPDFVQLLEKKKENSIESSINKLENVAQLNNDKKLIDIVKNIKSSTSELYNAKIEAEKETETLQGDLNEKKQEVEIVKRQNHFLKNTASNDVINLKSASHTVKIHLESISNYIKTLYKAVNDKNPDINQIKEIIAKINNVNQKSLILSDYMLKADFPILQDYLEDNIYDFFVEFIDEIYNTRMQKKLSISIKANNTKLICEFKPLAIGVIISNIVSNSEKAGAKNLIISINDSINKIEISFKDDGIGANNIKNLDDLFDIGYTTTNGTGIGLYNIKQMASEFKANVYINRVNIGFEIILRWSK